MGRLWVLGAALLCALGGCGASGPPAFQVQAGQYQAAFNASRDVLRDYRFAIERVDAAEGVISTKDKSSAGLATPWDGVQTTPKQELSDMLNEQHRRVRITFRPTGDSPSTDPPSSQTSCEGDVQVVIYRVQSALVRPSSRSIQLTTTAVDPGLSAKQIWSKYDVPVERDEALERRIARAIEVRLAEVSEQKAARSSPPQPDPAPLTGAKGD